MLLRKILFALVIASFLPFTVQADSLLPVPPKAKKNYNDKTKCVETVEEMRKNHMSHIIDQRDDTLRRGIRTTQYSLKLCIDCHNAPAEDGKVASSKSKEHFCSTCHAYAAVQIDCFKCHADKPENTEYRHSISTSQSVKHHDFATQDLSPETLKLLATEKEGQQ